MSDLTILPVKPLDDKKRIQVSDTFFDVNGGACVLDCAPPRSGKTVRISNYFLNPNFICQFVLSNPWKVYFSLIE